MDIKFFKFRSGWGLDGL